MQEDVICSSVWTLIKDVICNSVRALMQGDAICGSVRALIKDVICSSVRTLIKDVICSSVRALPPGILRSAAQAAGEQIDIHRSARAVVEIDLVPVNFSSTPPFSRRIRRNYSARVLGRSYRTFQTDCPVSPIFRSVHGRTGSRRSKVCAASKQSGYGLRRLKGPVP